MEQESQQATSAPASDTAVSEAELHAQFLRRRAELGVIDSPVRRLPKVAPPPPLTAEQLEEIEDRHRREDEAARRREVQERLDALCEQCGKRYADCRLDTFKTATDLQRTVVKELRGYCETIAERIAAGEGLVLYGPVGTGKDHLAFAVARAAALANFQVRWFNGQDWFGRIRDAMDDETSEASIISRVSYPRLVVISDPLPPVGSLSQHQSTMLYRAVESRYSGGNPTIVTLNVADDGEADARLGAATWDRLCHGAWKIRCRWPSYRKPARVIE